MTVRPCGECEKNIHPEEQSDLTQKIAERFELILCDNCVIDAVLNDGKKDAYEMRKDA